MPDFAVRTLDVIYRAMGLFSDPLKRLDEVPLGPGMTVVDYACGPGRFTVGVARRVGADGKVYAVDIQPLAVRMTADKARRAGIANIETIVARGYATGIPDSCADVVLLLDAFHQITDRPALLREIRRIVKPDGRFFMEPGHMPAERAQRLVLDSGQFRLSRLSGKNMLFEPVAGP